ncbi:hypothetical protein, partial [Leptospira kirschneri]|uniref:hypothetical protein n=1 Tax=Leptospira kirschneri TaxID=29507 RepID=UPI00211819EF
AFYCTEAVSLISTTEFFNNSIKTKDGSYIMFYEYNLLTRAKESGPALPQASRIRPGLFSRP